MKLTLASILWFTLSALFASEYSKFEPNYQIPAHHGEITYNPSYQLEYDQIRKIPLWAGYTLTAEQMQMPEIPRNKFHFKTDTRVSSCKPKDYTHSGYDRGHLVPARDMAYSEESLRDSFLMSNVTPQSPKLNRGRWSMLEKLVRHWATKFGKIYITTGPILFGNEALTNNGIPIPRYHFKVVLETTSARSSAIAFLVDQTPSAKVMEYVVSVDEVEYYTGLDFFSDLPDDVEDRVEAEIDRAHWN